MCTILSPRVALTGLDKVIIIVSSLSFNVSSIILNIELVPVVAPAIIVTVPLSRVKSMRHPEAVPLTVYSTSISFSAAKGIAISKDADETDSELVELVSENDIAGVPSLSPMV